MASTSGEILGNHVIVSGSYYARVRLDWQLAGQSVSGNYSTINWQSYVDFVGCDAQLQSGSVTWNGGQLWGPSGVFYSYQGNFSNHTVTMATGSLNIGHDANGNCTLNFGDSVNVYSSGTSSCSGSWALPQIPRYANIDGGPNFDDVTDEWIRVAWHADRSVDYISWWSNAYDGGGHHDTPASGQGWFYLDLHNLKSGTQYDFTVAIRNAASGLWTNSGVAYATTKQQNNFSPRRVM